MSLLNFGIDQIIIWLLVFTRTSGIFSVAPVFGNSHVPVYTRIGMAACLAFIFTPLVSAGHPTPPTELFELTFAIVRELAVGLAMGFVGMLLFMVIQAAAELIDLQMGLGFASLVDPNNEHTSVVGQFYYIVATLIFLSVNAHHMLLQGLADSFTIIPLGHMSFNPAATGSIVAVFDRMFVAAIKIGGPIVGVILLTDVALGILARTVPQLNVLVVGFPAKIFVGLATIIVAMPAVITVMHTLFGSLYGDLHILSQALVR
jgi:flagellar biosynthetic protein FliR